MWTLLCGTDLTAFGNGSAAGGRGGGGLAVPRWATHGQKRENRGTVRE